MQHNILEKILKNFYLIAKKKISMKFLGFFGRNYSIANFGIKGIINQNKSFFFLNFNNNLNVNRKFILWKKLKK